ncbi:MAG: sensor histidine kinase KdpD [Hyphomicrobiales bacterium]|nr:sensor histidine kinase KdpD [Hyphomicrobiales bacterium]
MAPENDRPTPDALLDEARNESRGKLKIFLGAYPGVGKTYSMLQAAHERRKEGLDVAVGVVETHGRAETEALLRDLEILPRVQITYRGRMFGEMNLDGLLARNPKLAIIDELAHTNVIGSRHEKRHQDVEELLAAGIDVYTTLNIQHVESLNDVITRISRIQVRETLPDKVLELASEIELVDLPPDDLIQRLRQGKVYVPEQAGRAIRNFFSKGNLTALRELAMRVAAERVDAQMVNYMRAHAIPGPWPAQDRLLVCINESPVSKRLVRTARRMAERSRIPWICVHVRTPTYDTLSEVAKGRIAEAMRLAESLEGEVVVLHAESRIVEELLAFSLKRNVTRMLIGRERRRNWSAWFRESVTQQILDKATQFEVTVISGDDTEGAKESISGGSLIPDGTPRDYVIATGAVAVATGIGVAAKYSFAFSNIALLLLIAVLLVAINYGRWPSFFASVLSFLVYDFVFTRPYYTFSIFDKSEVFTIILFLFASFIVGNLADRLRLQVAAMRTSAQRTSTLYEFSRKIAAAASLDDVLWAAVHHVASTMESSALVLLPNSENRLLIAAGYPPEDQLDMKDWGAAEWAWTNGKPAGWRSDTLPAADWLFLPLKTRRGAVGLLGVSFKQRNQPLTSEQWRLLEALVGQVAIAVERTNLASDIEEARVFTQTEQLRSALLSSVSHDLRTPLVSIIGSATSLSSYGDTLSDENRKQLVQTILDEGERLNRFVQNLLDMTRLGYGALQPKREWADMREITGRAIKQLRKVLGGRRVTLNVPETLPAIFVDPVLIEQVVANILDNAAKYTKADGRIIIEAQQVNNDLLLRITDDGPGIPPNARESVFDIFYRVRAGDGQAAGTGLGLSICRGIVEAHGGQIKAKDGPNGQGAVIEFVLPLTALPHMPDVADEIDHKKKTGKFSETADSYSGRR